MRVAILFFHQEVGWDLTVDAHPSLSLQLYVLFVVVSLAVVLANICRNWILLWPFTRMQGEADLRIACVFRRQALRLRRWMVLNILAWAAVTLAGILNLLRGLSAQRFAGLPRDRLRPTGCPEPFSAVPLDDRDSLCRTLAHPLACGAP